MPGLRISNKSGVFIVFFLNFGHKIGAHVKNRDHYRPQHTPFRPVLQDNGGFSLPHQAVRRPVPGGRGAKRGAVLTDKQERFCLEYVKHLNATRAAIDAGYSTKTARVTGSENLTKPDIQKRIQSLQSAQVQRLEIDADNLTRFFQSIMENKESNDRDRIKAAENLGKRIGYYEEDNKQKQINIPIEAWLKQNSE